MTETTQHKLTSVTFAVLWTGSMWWWSAPQTEAQAIILAVCGAIAGFSWHFGFGRLFRLHFEGDGRAHG